MYNEDNKMEFHGQTEERHHGGMKRKSRWNVEFRRRTVREQGQLEEMAAYEGRQTAVAVKWTLARSLTRLFLKIEKKIDISQILFVWQKVYYKHR